MRDALLNAYPWIKATHIAATIAWMAALLYLPRLFVYHFQSAPGGEAERLFTVMERRLAYGIMRPSMLAVWILALTMLYANPGLLSAGWFHVKLVAVILLTVAHSWFLRNQRRFAAGERPRSERFWRIANEIPFVLMLVAVFMAVPKPF